MTTFKIAFTVLVLAKLTVGILVINTMTAPGVGRHICWTVMAVTVAAGLAYFWAPHRRRPT
ncbi:hypothetical protein ABT369_38750 [Dactylosporangium sp. NPDC000244]|uniref:hypothetical protein n=1 Tax=Dactylosporangium sp. NPDC000244 TaxID=3154365 RepID=UPI003321F225